MRKIVVVLLSVFMIFSMTACNGNKAPQSVTPPPLVLLHPPLTRRRRALPMKQILPERIRFKVMMGRVIIF
jgi:hypothetical protein